MSEPIEWWYADENHEQQGLFSDDEMVALFKQKSISSDTEVWNETLDGWINIMKTSLSIRLIPILRIRVAAEKREAEKLRLRAEMQRKRKVTLPPQIPKKKKIPKIPRGDANNKDNNEIKKEDTNEELEGREGFTNDGNNVTQQQLGKKKKNGIDFGGFFEKFGDVKQPEKHGLSLEQFPSLFYHVKSKIATIEKMINFIKAFSGHFGQFEVDLTQTMNDFKNTDGKEALPSTNSFESYGNVINDFFNHTSRILAQHKKMKESTRASIKRLTKLFNSQISELRKIVELQQRLVNSLTERVENFEDVKKKTTKDVNNYIKKKAKMIKSGQKAIAKKGDKLTKDTMKVVKPYIKLLNSLNDYQAEIRKDVEDLETRLLALERQRITTFKEVWTAINASFKDIGNSYTQELKISTLQLSSIHVENDMDDFIKLVNSKQKEYPPLVEPAISRRHDWDFDVTLDEIKTVIE